MLQDAFELSERIKSPVFFRATTRVDHGYEAIDVKDPGEYNTNTPEGFIKDSSKWVIFPRLSVKNHALIEKRNAELSDELSSYPGNTVKAGDGKYPRLGIASHGVNWGYTLDALGGRSPRLLKISTPFPFPEKLAVEFLTDLDEVLCVEELDPVIERALTYVCGKYGLKVNIRGKLTGDIPPAGENNVDIVKAAVNRFLGETAEDDCEKLPEPPPLPVRPPVLCAGCPHRASFYAVKQAMKGQKTVYCGDIGCYTLGNAQPLDMCDTCLCMGAGINIAQGIYHIEPDTKCFAFVGDSTFFASGITGVVNAFYNQADLTLIVLDNSTTAMTGHQPHPATGVTAMGQIVEKVSIEAVLRAIGLTTVETVDPLDHKPVVETVKRAAAQPGVKAVIFRSPCVAVTKPKGRSKVDAEKCVGCRRCIKELGCPGLTFRDGKAVIDDSLCTGCTLCEQICPVSAISGGEKNA